MGDPTILAPQLKCFGEDNEIDHFIIKYCCAATRGIHRPVEENEELRKNLSTVVHLLLGFSEGRFTITSCPGHLSKEEIEGVKFRLRDLSSMQKRDNPDILRNGFNTLPGGMEIFHISNPDPGLWASKDKFNN